MAPDRRIGGVSRPPVVEALRDLLPDSAVRGVKGAAGLVGRATAGARALPDFLVVGTKKGGTTSLMDWLSAHPDVARLFPPFQRRKSPHYFDLNYWRSGTWYRSHFRTRLTMTMHEKRTGVRPVVGEASPYYMFHPAVPQRAARLLPQAKILMVLREPVSRAYSNYWDRYETGHESLETFEAAVDAEAQRLAGVSEEQLLLPDFYSFDHDHHSYLARGRYAEQIRRWMEHYPADKILILSATDLSKRPQESFDQVQQFLGISGAPVTLRSRNARKYPPISEATKSRLAAYYEPYNQELYELLGRDFGW